MLKVSIFIIIGILLAMTTLTASAITGVVQDFEHLRWIGCFLR
jgi:hypothetical protein